MSDAQTETRPRLRRPGLPDLLACAGAVLVECGAWRAGTSAGLMVTGLILLALALLCAAGERRAAR